MIFFFELKKYSSNLKKILYGYFVSGIGNASARVTLAMIVYQISGSKVTLAASFLLANLPVLLFGNPLGKLCEKFDQRKMMIVLDVLGFITFALLSFFYQTLGLMFVFSLYFISNIFVFMFRSAKIKLITKLYSGSEKINQITTMLLQLYYITLAIGPLVAGYLIQWIDIKTALIFNSLTFLISILCVYNIDSSSENENIFAAFKDVFRFKNAFGFLENINTIKDVPVLLHFTLLYLFRATGYGILNSLLPVIVLNNLHLDSQGLGKTFFFLVVGTTIGTYIYGKYIKLRIPSTGSLQTKFLTVATFLEIILLNITLNAHDPFIFFTFIFLSGIVLIVFESRGDYVFADFAPVNAKASIQSFQLFIKSTGLTIGTLITVSLIHQPVYLLTTIISLFLIASLVSFYIYQPNKKPSIISN